MFYFLCYELEKVKKEEVDFWTSRHERVKDQSSVTFKELLSKTLDKLNNIEIRNTNNNYNIL